MDTDCIYTTDHANTTPATHCITDGFGKVYVCAVHLGAAVNGFVEGHVGTVELTITTRPH